MKTFSIAALVAVGLTLAAAGGAEAKGKCVSARHQGIGLSADIAKPLALDGLKQVIATNKWTAKGDVGYKCEGNVPVVTCTASQKACP